MTFNASDNKYQQKPAWYVAVRTGAHMRMSGWYPGDTRAEALSNAFKDIGPNAYVHSAEVRATGLTWAQQLKDLQR